MYISSHVRNKTHRPMWQYTTDRLRAIHNLFQYETPAERTIGSQSVPRRRSVSATPASVGLRVYCLRPTLHLQLAIDYSPRLSDRPTGELRLRDGLGPSTCLQNIWQYKYSSGFSTDLASLKPFIYYIIYFIACHLLLVPLCYANHRTAKYCIHKKQYLRTKITIDETEFKNWVRRLKNIGKKIHTYI